VKCVTVTRYYGSNMTNVWQEILMLMTLEFSGEVVNEKLYKNPSIFVKVILKNQWHLLYVDTVYSNN